MLNIDEDKYYSMPVFFGGSSLRVKASMGQCEEMSLTFYADSALLEKFLPDGFRLLSPELQYGFFRCSGISWLQGRALNIFMVSVPVEYRGNEEGLTGILPLVLWHDNVYSIMTVREEAGIAALYGEISYTRLQNANTLVRAGSDEHPFIEMEFQEDLPFSEQDIAKHNEEVPSRQFGWRYIPNIGAPGAALSHATMMPFHSSASAGWKGHGKVVWHRENFALYPHQQHIFEALSRIMMEEETDGHQLTGQLHLMPELARPLP